MAEPGAPARDVSAIVVTYNSARIIEHGLRSLLRHPGQRLAEIVVVDNASTDTTREIVHALSEETADGGLPIRLAPNGKNAGYGTGANAGASIARPESHYLLLMNPDISVREAVIDDMCQVLDGDSTVGLVGPRLEYTDEYGYPSPFSNPFWLRGIVARVTRGRLGRIRPGDYRASFLVLGYCTLARRSAFEQAGGFDENIFLYMEEPVIAMRLRRVGQKTVYVWTRSSVRHFQNTSTEPAGGDPAIRGRHKIELYLASERYLMQHYLPRWLPYYRWFSTTALYEWWIRYVEQDLVGTWETAKPAPRAS